MRRGRVLLLTTIGRRSGEKRTLPLIYVNDGDALVVIASNGGRPRHPTWFLNLQAHPEAEVRIGPETRRVRFRVRDTIKRRNGATLVVQSVIEQQGLIFYRGEGQTLCETELSDFALQ